MALARDKYGEPFSRDWMFAVAGGLLPGHSRVAGLGNNPDIDTSTFPEDVWSNGGLYPWLAAAVPMEMLSSSASDAAAGVGARTVLINGLDANYNAISETITLNGITPVATTRSYLRINNLLVMSAGTSKTNVGTITLRTVATVETHATIPVGAGTVGGYGISRRSIFTVPAGNTLFIDSFFGCVNRSTTQDAATIATFFQSPNGFYRMTLEFSITNAPYRHDGFPPIVVAEKNDFCLRCNYTSTNNMDLTAAWLGVLINNSYL